MSITTRQLDTTELEERVKRVYQEVAVEPEHEFHFETGRALAERLSYPTDDLDAVPAAAIESFAGVGYFLDLAAIAPGEAVLDLGSGSGTDSFVAARATGPDGQVLGLDMTEAQLAKARRLAAENGFAQVDFRAGYIERAPGRGRRVRLRHLERRDQPVAGQAGRVRGRRARPAFGRAPGAGRHRQREAAPRGRDLRCLAVGRLRIGGAMQRDGYRQAIEAAGFGVEAWRENDAYRFVSERAANATQKYGVTSISLLARRH
jgi:arsenite methyltransferase